MTEPLPHLRLRRGVAFATRKRRTLRSYKRSDRDHVKFRAAIAASPDDLARYHDRSTSLCAASGYVPAQIFEMRLTQRVGYNAFKADLESVGIETVSSALERRRIVEGARGFRGRLAAKTEERVAGKRPMFVDAIERIGAIPPEAKIDRRLLANPVGGTIEAIDVETWPITGDRLEKFGNALYKIVMDGGGSVDDMFHTSDYCAIRVRCNTVLFREVASLPEVARMSWPLQMRVDARLNSSIVDFGSAKAPDPGAPGILVIDSGVARHPLLEYVIAGFVPAGGPTGTRAGVHDDQGHGTHVAGVAAYGDVQACVDGGAFEPKVRLYAAKVMKRGPDGEAEFDTLIDGKIRRAVDEVAARDPSCRIVNLSLGDSARTIAPGMPQPRLASLVDRLSASHKGLLFVVSAGNIEDDAGSPYPLYLLDRPPATRLIDPATSAHAITVGSIFQGHDGMGREGYPSPATRVGPGLAGMAKPDVVDYGGGYAGPGSLGVLTMNREWAQDGRLFTFSSGTSMSAPGVAHKLALMQRAMPGASRNLLKALLISSAEIPTLRPPPLDALSAGNGRDLSTLSHIYGHGRPDLDRATHCRQNRAVLVHDGSMRLGHAELFAVQVPTAFTAARGRKAIEVSLAFDPPTDAKRRDYLGAAMNCHLYKNVGMDAVRRRYEGAGMPVAQGTPAPVPTSSKVKLVPGAGRRGAGIYQKARAASRGNMGIDPSRPLVLAVTAEKRWDEAHDHTQSYAVVVTLEHSSNIDIYTALRSGNAAGTRGGASE